MKFNIDKEDYSIEENKEIIDIDSYNSSYFYGEVNSNDIYNVLQKIFKYTNYDNFEFLDIGSGCGKLILYISNKINCCCTGIEIIKHRYLKSLKLLKDNNYDIEFINDDFKNIYLGNYDIIFCCNLVFSENDNNMLYNKLNKEFKGYSILFNYNDKIKYNFISKHIVNTSWEDNVYVYLFYF